MPTKRRRHAITETPPVEAALNSLRQRLGQDRVDLADLVVRGAGHKLAELRAADEAVAARRKRLADRVRARGVPVDLDAAEKVRRHGWTPHA